MMITKTKLEEWIKKSIEATHSRIDEAISKDYQYIRHHYEGYLECLMQLQNLIDTQ